MVDAVLQTITEGATALKFQYSRGRAIHGLPLDPIPSILQRMQGEAKIDKERKVRANGQLQCEE